MKPLKYNRNDHPEFFKVLRSRVNNYFQENNISRHGDYRMVIKSVFMISLYIVPFILLLTNFSSNSWFVLGMWSLMGLGMAGIGLSVMHDANHGAYSTNKTVNKLMGGLIAIIGGYSNNWKIQHNVLHHSYTNVHGYDEDIESALFRFSPSTKIKSFHKYQYVYGPFAYALMTIYWFSVKDFAALVKYRDEGLLKTQGLKFSSALTDVVTNKIIYVGLFLVLPLILIDAPIGIIILGFFLMHFICGALLAFIFQCAHVLEDTSFFDVQNKHSLENSWAIHQIRTTANFAKRSRIFSWFIGGLNFQIEHHLFPNICHVHYRKISRNC